MICQKCGREIADGAAFCPYCGRATGNIAHQTEFNNMVKKKKIQIRYVMFCSRCVQF